jgi:hypothetical protein
MPAAGDILIANGLALAAQGGGVAYKGIVRQDSEDPIWDAYLDSGAIGSQAWSKSAYAGRILRARFSPGLSTESGVVMSAISPLNGDWVLRAHMLFGVSTLETVETRVVTIGVHQWQGHILAEFQQLDAVWRVVTAPSAVSIASYDSTSWSSGTAYTAAGSAPISPVVTINTGSPGSGSAPNRYSFTLTNTLSYPIVKHPWLVHLGSTTGWTGSTAANTFLFCDGIEVPREVIAMGEARSYILFTIDRLAQGQTKTYEILTGGTAPAVATTAQALSGRQRAPVADFGWQVVTSTSASVGTTVTASALATGTSYVSAPTDRWKYGVIYGLTGASAGQAQYVTANSATTITTEFAFTAAVSGSKYLVMSSSLVSNLLNLTYAVRQTEHSDYPHGLIYQDRAQNAPQDAAEDAPLSWQRARTFDNNDDVAAPQITAINVGTVDYFGIPNISRTWQGGDDNSSVKERGTADGYVYSSPFPVTRWRLDYAFKNPNGVAKAVIGSRQTDAENWTAHVENTTAYSTLTDIAIQDIAPPSRTHHLLFALWPRYGDEIPTSWARDSGGRSGGGYTTMDDDTKDWVTDQWVNARWRVTSGKGQGQSRTVTSNDANTVTWSTVLPSDDVVPNDGSRYEVVQKALIANLQSDDTWVVTVDVSGITQGTVTSMGAAERVSVRVRANGGASATTSHVYLNVGVDARYLWVANGNTVVVDCQAKTALVMNGSTVVRDVTDWVRAYEVLADTPTVGTTFTGKTPDWFAIQPGSGTFYTQRVLGAATHATEIVLRTGFLG